MAMAKVVLPELTGEDHLTPFPRAPPPSPEMQPRSHSRVFEIPSSKFEGIGLDLRRTTFQFDDEDESPLADNPVGGGGGGYEMDDQLGTSLFSRDSEDEDEDSYPGSPQKRVCCSPNTLSRDFMTTVFPSSTLSSLVSSGFGSFQAPSPPCPGSILPGNSSGNGFQGHFGDGVATRFHSNSPPYLGTVGQSSPQVLMTGGGAGKNGRGCGEISSSSQVTTTAAAAATHLTTPTLYPPVTLSIDQTTLSRSYDLHKMHPHLPESFETTQLPEVRPCRSRTLDSTSPSYYDDPPRSRSQTLDASYGEEVNQRRRKISIKRKNPEDEVDDQSLQFSFEYSYSSTGSSGESDWLMVDCKAEPTRPMEKKACCAGDPSSVALSQGVGMTGASALQPGFAGFSPRGGGGLDGGGEGLFVPHSQQQQQRQQQSPLTLGGLNMGTSFPINGASPQGHFTTLPYNSTSITTTTAVGGVVSQGVMGVVSEHSDALASYHQQQQQQQSLESVTMMDLEGRLDSLDSMDCDQLPITAAPVSSDVLLMRGVAGGDVTTTVPVSVTPSPSVSSNQLPLSAVTMEHAPFVTDNGPVMRSHLHHHNNSIWAGQPHPTHSFPPGLRHSCVEGYLQKPGGQGALSDDDATMLRADNINLSKSL